MPQLPDINVACLFAEFIFNRTFMGRTGSARARDEFIARDTYVMSYDTAP